METVPFNNLDPGLGRAAVAEYLVWKFFPERAEMRPLNEALAEFVKGVLEKAKTNNDDQLVYEMIYSEKYDWQRLAVIQAKASGGEHG